MKILCNPVMKTVCIKMWPSLENTSVLKHDPVIKALCIEVWPRRKNVLKCDPEKKTVCWSVTQYGKHSALKTAPGIKMLCVCVCACVCVCMCWSVFHFASAVLHYCNESKVTTKTEPKHNNKHKLSNQHFYHNKPQQTPPTQCYTAKQQNKVLQPNNKTK